MKKLLLAAICCTSAFLSGATRPGLTGTVLDSNGNPLPGVTVMVYHAGVKVGFSTFCPSCYFDCGKRTITDARGTFAFQDLSPDLWFTLLAARDGYVPEVTERIDPAKAQTVALKLAAKPPTADFSGTVRGRVVEPNGSPVPYAIVNPKGLIAETVAAYGSLPGLEPISVTNERGEFEIAYSKPTPKMLLEVEARGFAPKFAVMQTGLERHSITVSDGATIAGRLVQDGRPVTNAQVAIIAKDRGAFGGDLKIYGNPYEVVRIGTDASGRFTIPNIPATVDWYVYPTMDSVDVRGAASPIEVHTVKDGEYLKVPELVLKPGLHLRGTVLASDNKPIAEGMRVGISSAIIWDSQTVSLPADGRFEFNNLPAGKYAIFVSVKGYRQNTSKYGPEPFPVDRNIDNFSTTIYPNVP